MNKTCNQDDCCRQLQRDSIPLRRNVPILDEVVPCCEFYPVSIDVDRRLLSFARISRDTYRNSAFLVPRHTDMGRKLYTFNLDDLLLRSMSSPLQCARTHYILISAFCCSTLLARYLDQIVSCLVLKEPPVVAQLGFLRYRRQEASHEKWQAEWRRLATLGLALMSRAFSPDDTVVIKPSDIGNCVGDVVLEHDLRSKAVVLSITLRTFILSVLKSDSRRDWTRGRAKFWRKTIDEFPSLTNIDLKPLDDARLSAYVWLVNNAFWAELRKKTAPERILVMNGDEVSDSPVTALSKVLRFFEVGFEPNDLTRIANSEAASRHSKRPRTSYDASARRADLLDWEKRFCEETDHAIAWAQPIAEDLRLGRIDGPVAGVAPELAEVAVPAGSQSE
jgi:hypothetical protein